MYGVSIFLNLNMEKIQNGSNMLIYPAMQKTRQHWSQLNCNEERLFLFILCTKKAMILCPHHKSTYRE